MTETDFGTTFTSPRLERPSDAPLGGVSLALARTTGTDVVLWRVLFVVLSLFGGLGVALYLACYVSIPVEGVQHSLVTRVLHGPDRRVSTRQVLLLALVVVCALGALHDNSGAVVGVGLAALGYVWWRRRHPTSGAPSALPPLPVAAPAAPPVPAAEPSTYPGADASPPAGAAPAWQPPAPRPRSLLTPLTLSAASLVVGLLLLLAAAGAFSLPTEVVVAAALGVVGLGLVASAWWGRARGLVPVALLLALGLAGTAGARPVLDHGVGTRTWTAASSGSYRLGAGEATLTLLAQPTADGVRDITARVTFGHLVVRVPAGLRAVVDVRVTNGDVQAQGVDDNGRRIHRTFTYGPPGAPEVHVDARVAVGQVEVRDA